MLQRLFIRNYAIIESVEIEFSGKLNIITGETGAGKSILVGALGLILGERADSSVLFNATKNALLKAAFLSGAEAIFKRFCNRATLMRMKR